MNTGRGRRLVDMIKLSDGVDIETERVQQLAVPQCSTWPDKLIAEDQNILIEPKDDIIAHTPKHNPEVQDTFSPSLLAFIQSSDKENKKYQDLQKALQWVPPIFHNFYTTLAHDGTACDLPED
ncbi:unnamed protein product, partial [Brenthis ino]